MTILEADIKLLASRVMDDVPEGGGGPTGTVIPYGTSNAMFSDITETDRAGGNVSIRQAHVAVMTPNAEQYMGANVILSGMPNDPNVSITLAKCSLFARRTDIARAIANYLIEGITWAGFLLEDHVLGMRSIQIFHRPGSATPDIGRTLVLSYLAGTANERIQFVRVQRTETVVRTFTEMSGGSLVDYQAAVTKVDLTDALRFAFPGSPPTRSFAVSANKTILRDTTVADAATYYGASTVASPVSLGDSTLRVSSIYTQLVPSSRTETTALDQRPANERTVLLATAPKRVEVSVAAHTRRIKISQSNRGFSFVSLLKPLPEPGTLVISYRALGSWYTLSDDGAGNLTGSGAGRVIYTTGSLEMTLLAMPDDGSAVIIQWGERVAYTSRTGQGASIRPPEYAWSLTRLGADRNSVSIKWPSGGVVRTATDNGQGKLTGDAVGEIDYPTSSIFLRPTAMPDPGSQFTTTYDVSAIEAETFTAPAVDVAGMISLTLAKQPLAGSVEVAWITAQEVSQTSGSTLTESSVGKAETSVSNSTWRAASSAWDYYRALAESGGAEIPPAIPVGTIGSAPLIQIPNHRQGSATLSSTYSRMTATDATNSRRILTVHSATDDGMGGFLAGLGDIVYSTRKVNIKVVEYDRSTSSYKSDHEDAKEFANSLTNGSSSNGAKGGEYGTSAVSEQQLGQVSVRYKVAPLSPVGATESYTPPDATIDLCPYTTDRIVPGSLRFGWMGQTYDDFEGVLYRGRTELTPGIASGVVDYAAGLAHMSDYVVGANPASVALQSLWTQRAPWNTASVFFRTQAAPLAPGGLVLTLLDLAGNALTVTTNLDGSFGGSHTTGRMDFESGVGELQFGDFVDAATLTDAQKAEWWYSAADVGAVEPGKIWRPWPVDPSTLRYNSVAYFYLPLDADILGLDPVRLPPDGRVPIYRVGSYVVVGHTGVVPAVNYSAGTTVDCGRTRLSRVYLVGADGKLITTGYTVNLDAGRVTVVEPSTWVQPVTIKHRIEEMARLADVQIDGSIKLTKQLSHNFPAGSIVSTAVMAGNLRARALPVFDQLNWDGVTWLDVVGPTGPAPATYNDGAFPILVTNAGAMSERFALRVLSGGIEVEVIGEHVGNIGTYSRNTDIAPINPVSGAPYFVLKAAGWGNGWAAGNVMFLPTAGTYYPLAVIRTVQPSEAVGTDYAFEIAARGDIDREPTNPVI